MACSFSSVITRINSALECVNFLDTLFPSWCQSDIMRKRNRYWLKNLRTFVLCARKLGDKKEDGSLGSLLIKIEDTANKYSQVRPPNFLGLDDGDIYGRAETVFSDFERGFESLKIEIDKWYPAMSDNTRQSNSLTVDEVGEITESIRDNLVDLQSFGVLLEEATYVLPEHMNFLKNFCRFATIRGVDHGKIKDFLTHTVAVALRAAYLCFLLGEDTDFKQNRYDFKQNTYDFKESEDSGYETEIEDSGSEDSGYEADGEERGSETSGEEWWRAMRFKISMLGQKIIPIDPKVCEAYTQVMRCSKLSTQSDAPTRDMDDDSTIVMKNFIDSLISILWDMLRLDTCHVVCHVVCLKDNWQLLYEGLRSLRTIMKKLPNSIDEKTRDDIGFVVCDAGALVFSFYQKNVEIEPGLQDLLERIKVFVAGVEEKVAQTSTFNLSRINELGVPFDSVIEDIQNIKTDSWESSYGKRHDIKVKEVSNTYSHVLPSQKIASFTTEVVGFHDVTRSIKDRLQRGSKQLRVIAIVGMGGGEKTTLAAKVYADPVVMRYFSAHAMCTVSQTWDKKKLLLELLDQIHAEKCSERTEVDLADKLRKHLKGKQYLIFLDDVWTIEVWNSLRASFPNDDTGSRIILTSRNHDVAMLDKEPLYLRELNKEESLQLLQRKLFPGKDWPLELDNLGMQIAEKCKGLPLTIVLVAGLLATAAQEGWKEIVDGLSSGAVSITEQCMSSMELSYQHLPDYLKPCFLYFGAFPEDHEVSVRRLIQLWIAEGFIRKSELKSLEDAAEGYMKDLIGRSLVMVAKQRFIGGAKTCRIHDLLHDFCLRKAKGEHFFHLVKGYDELLAFNEPCNLRRLCIHCEPEHLKESKLFCPRARSLLFFSAGGECLEQEALINMFLIHIFKFVEVLDLEEINLGSVFPREIELLVQLRYLAIRGKISVIPSWVGNLSMLETFIVDSCGRDVSLPDTLWNLRKLKYLYIRTYSPSSDGALPIENLDDSSVLYELDIFVGAVFVCQGSMEKQMRKFPNIRKLRCNLVEDCNFGSECQKFGVSDFPSGLESLTMILNAYRTNHRQLKLSFPANLKKLTLEGFKLPWSKISTIGGLPNLEVLKLLIHSFSGKTWEMKEGEFPKLRYLKLSNLKLVRWRTASDSDYQFPCLQKLVLERLWRLEEMPSCLESTQTLEIIEVSCCSEATKNLVKDIQEQQVSLGNTALNILIVDDVYWQG